MPNFSKNSMVRLNSCHRDLQTVLHQAIKHVDFSVVSGHRSPEEQASLFKKGRAFDGSRWVVKNMDEVVTFKDGTDKRSKHNYYPSKAVDIIPYPSGYKDQREFYYLAGVIKMISEQFLKAGKIETPITWGGRWDWQDLPHFQI